MPQIAETHSNWKGGRYIDSYGYVLVRIAKNKYRREHRLIVEQSLGRELVKSEVVHHKNGNKQDNRLENLLLTSASEHTRLHWEEGSLLSFGMKERPDSNCHPNRKHYAKGLCQKCYMNLAQKEYKAQNPDKVREAKKRYNAKNRDKINEYKRQRRAAGLPS